MDWKFNRFLNWYAWKYWFNFVNIVIVFLAVCAAFITAGDQGHTELNVLMWVLLSVVLLYSSIESVCSPQQRLCLEKGAYACVYQEYTHHFCIVVKESKSQTTIWTNEYDYLFKNAPHALFVYRSLKDDMWYLWQKNALEKTLGERINKILFRLEEKLFVLAYNEVQSFNSKYICCQDVYIPQGTQTTDKEQVPLETPDEVLLIKKGETYESYGFYLSGEMPYYRHVILSTIIFREGGFRSILLWEPEKKTYVVLHRSQELHRRLNTYFYEFDSRYRIGGTILRYQPDSKSFKRLYHGNFNSVNFESGLVWGEDGKVYGEE